MKLTKKEIKARLEKYEKEECKLYLEFQTSLRKINIKREKLTECCRKHILINHPTKSDYKICENCEKEFNFEKLEYSG